MQAVEQESEVNDHLISTIEHISVEQLLTTQTPGLSGYLTPRTSHCSHCSSVNWNMPAQKWMARVPMDGKQPAKTWFVLLWLQSITQFHGSGTCKDVSTDRCPRAPCLGKPHRVRPRAHSRCCHHSHQTSSNSRPVAVGQPTLTGSSWATCNGQPNSLKCMPRRA